MRNKTETIGHFHLAVGALGTYFKVYFHCIIFHLIQLWHRGLLSFFAAYSVDLVTKGACTEGWEKSPFWLFDYLTYEVSKIKIYPRF